jgi:Domain of unknown function (DUF4126)
MSEFDIVVSIALGVGLAAAVGFRVFLPLLVMGGAAYTGHLTLSDGLEWLATPTALAMLSVAAILEIFAYYFPGSTICSIRSRRRRRSWRARSLPPPS